MRSIIQESKFSYKLSKLHLSQRTGSLWCCGTSGWAVKQAAARGLARNWQKKKQNKKKTKRLQGRNCLPERDVMISETWQVLQLRRKQTLLQKRNLIAWRCHSPARMYQYSVILFQRLGKLCSVSMSGMAGHVCLPAVFNFFCSEPIIIL